MSAVNDRFRDPYMQPTSRPGRRRAATTNVTVLLDDDAVDRQIGRNARLEPFRILTDNREYAAPDSAYESRRCAALDDPSLAHDLDMVGTGRGAAW